MTKLHAKIIGCFAFVALTLAFGLPVCNQIRIALWGLWCWMGVDRGFADLAAAFAAVMVGALWVLGGFIVWVNVLDE